ncbi:MAG: alkaline phosphatase family protein [Actinomycetota bacterium]
MRLLRGPVSLVAAIALALACAGTARGERKPTTPVRHLITLMQENHTFDNYFGTYPGADGLPPGTCMPRDVARRSAGCVKPFHVGGRPVRDLGHNATVYEEQFRQGRMDGFVDVFRRQGIDGSLAMGFYDDRDLPYYWNVADEYVLFDRFFTSAAAGSVVNHMYWIAGAPGTPEDKVPAGGFNVPTIFDRLEEQGISWKFYVQNYDPKINFRTPGSGDHASQVVWAPLLAYPRYLDNPDLFRHIVPIDEFFDDLLRGTLPAVSYMVPSGASEHPPGSILAGQRFVRTLINALMRSDSWSSSAFIWAYDDWGGWYDHVKPPPVKGESDDRLGYGFRSPALLVSAFARRGYIDSTQLDFTSILKFIEENWRLEPLAERDRSAKSFAGAFDFTRGPRPARFLAAERPGAEPAEPRRAVIYVGYGSALGAATLLMAWPLVGAGLVGRRRRRRRAGSDS